MIYHVIDHPFNRANYSDQIGLLLANPIAYAIVKVLPNPYREHSCWKCNHVWRSKVQLKTDTPNLSGEVTPHCPECNQKSTCSSSWILSDGNQYPFPEPIKQTKGD